MALSSFVFQEFPIDPLSVLRRRCVRTCARDGLRYIKDFNNAVDIGTFVILVIFYTSNQVIKAQHADVR